MHVYLKVNFQKYIVPEIIFLGVEIIHSFHFDPGIQRINSLSKCQLFSQEA